MQKGLRNTTFVCLDDVSGCVEDMNYVIYNPTVDGTVQQTEKLYRYIKERFNIELTSADMTQLLSHDEQHLTEFVIDLKRIIEKRRRGA